MKVSVSQMHWKERCGLLGAPVLAPGTGFLRQIAERGLLFPRPIRGIRRHIVNDEAGVNGSVGHENQTSYSFSKTITL